MRMLALVSHKGRIGKTTSAVSLATGLAAFRRRLRLSGE